MDIVQNKFKIIKISPINCNYNKITIDKTELKNCISFLKNSAEFSADILISIAASDYIDKLELIYDIYSSKLNQHKYISIYVESLNPTAESICEIFKSAEYDEREIFDLFGIKFTGNNNLKRLLLPNSTIGHPLLKNFRQTDERLAQNE